ncbi:unnamed protein product, partial [Iphiclides podalirius]
METVRSGERVCAAVPRALRGRSGAPPSQGPRRRATRTQRPVARRTPTESDVRHATKRTRSTMRDELAWGQCPLVTEVARKSPGAPSPRVEAVLRWGIDGGIVKSESRGLGSPSLMRICVRVLLQTLQPPPPPPAAPRAPPTREHPCDS